MNIVFSFLLDTPCVSSVSLSRTSSTTIAFRWIPPAPDLSYAISVCLQGSSSCSHQENCSGCSSTEARDLEPEMEYIITVSSFTTLLAGDCFSKGCTSSSIKASTSRCGGWYNMVISRLRYRYKTQLMHSLLHCVALQ